MMAEISALVKGVRQLLGLTQKQLARELGVGLSTVNQWENTRRRPQPVLLARHWEIKTTLSQGSSDHLTRHEAWAFNQRWDAVHAAKRQELASTPVVQKFHQMEALLASARHLGWIEARTAEEIGFQERWARLRRILPT
jgi:transcriptional regulator with XRE-family HTH domain